MDLGVALLFDLVVGVGDALDSDGFAVVFEGSISQKENKLNYYKTKFPPKNVIAQISHVNRHKMNKNFD